jgi:hypothetical protein
MKVNLAMFIVWLKSWERISSKVRSVINAGTLKKAGAARLLTIYQLVNSTLKAIIIYR